MIKSNILDIINEEITNFDYLSMNKNQKENDYFELLSNPDFQKQIICDSFLNKNKFKISISDSSITGDWDCEENGVTYMNLVYSIKIQYKYDQNYEPITFGLDFYGNNIGISKTGNNIQGDYNTEPIQNKWINGINWSSINVSLNTDYNDEVKFTAFESAPSNIQTIFIREFIADFINEYTGYEIKSPEMNISSKSIQYC